MNISLALLIGLFQFGQLNAISPDQARVLIERERDRFESRPPIAFGFQTEYQPIEGNPGNPSYKEMRDGTIRVGSGKVEAIHVSDKWDRLEESFKPARAVHRLWRDEDEHTLGLRTYFSNDGETNHGYKEQVKYHEGVRPDMEGWFLDGVFVDSNNYSDMLLRASELSGKIERLDDGKEYIRIDGEGPDGRTTAWLEREGKNLLHRLHFEAGDNLTQSLNGVQGFTFDLVVSNYMVDGDVAIPTEGEATYSFDLPDTTTPKVLRIVAQRKNVKLNPDFAALQAFQFSFDEGTIVDDHDIRNQRYVWRDGKLQPYIDMSTESIIEAFAEKRLNAVEDELNIESESNPELVDTDGSELATKKQTDSPAETRPWGYGVALAVVFVVSIVFWFQRRKQSN